MAESIKTVVIAAQPGCAEAEIARQVAHRLKFKYLDGDDFVRNLNSSGWTEADLVARVRDIPLGEKEHLVILSTAAAFELGGKNTTATIQLVAPQPDRIEKYAMTTGLEPQAAAVEIRAADARHAAFMAATYGVDWAVPTNYHLSINVAGLPLTTVVNIICNFVKSRKQASYLTDTVAIHRAFEQLANKPAYTVDEAASLLTLPAEVIRQAVYDGELERLIIAHNVEQISHAALSDWLQRLH